MIRGKVRGLLLLAATAATLLAVAAPAGAASAQTREPAASFTVQAVFTGAGTGSRVPGRIVCHGGPSRPYYILPNHRSIATAGVVQCSSRVAGISFSILLTKDFKVAAKKGVATLGKKRAAGAATYKCPTNRTHRYAGVMFGLIVFPPGYTPHERTFAVQSLPARLRCRG
jgi:hypothetical protein